MKADTLNLTAVFGKDIRYVVPIFQRAYVWKQDEHWEPLWEDIRVTTERLLEERETATDWERENGVPEQHTPPHFLGALVLDQLKVGTKMLEARHVIDGQQRLTTLQLFIAAAHAAALDHGVDDQAPLLAKLLTNDPVLVTAPDDRFKVWPTNVDRDVFRAVMSDDGHGATDVTGHGKPSRIAKAHRYFLSELDEWINEAAEGDRTQRFDALTHVLWALLQVVVIDLEEQDNAQVIFETLNARGTPLLASDLVKNLVFQAATQTGAKVEELYERYWKPFDTDTWRRDIRVGRLHRPRLDVFLSHWLTMRQGKEVRAHQLFPTFRTYLKTSERPVADVLDDVAQYATVYDHFENWPWESPEGQFFDWLEVTQTTTAHPVLLWLFGLTDDVLNTDARRGALAAIESWLIRRMIARLTTKNYNIVFLDLLRHLKKNPSGEAGRDTVTFLREREGDSQYWPDDAEIVDAMVNLPVSGRINQQRLTMVFRVLERAMRSELTETVSIGGNLHIEHILPKKWEQHWPLPENEEPEVARINREKLKDTFGNLTLLTEKLNPKLSNRSWSEKRELVAKHSVLMLNKDVLEHADGGWDEAAIRERGRRLASYAIKIWPGPKADVWPSA